MKRFNVYNTKGDMIFTVNADNIKEARKIANNVVGYMVDKDFSIKEDNENGNNDAKVNRF